MTYLYGTSSVAEFPTPLDDTPLDATSWGHLVDAIGVQTIQPVASLTEQNEYLAAVTAAGLGPSLASPISVRRMDLVGLVMVNDGTGWRRSTGGSLSVNAFSNAAVTESAGTISSRGAITLNLPCTADISVQGVIMGIPPEAPDNWAFYVWLETSAGVELTPHIVYGNLPRTPYPAIVPAVGTIPAGSSQIILKTQVNALSGPVTWAHVSLSASYA